MSRRVSRILSGMVALGSLHPRPWRRAHLRLLVAAGLEQRHRVETRHGSLTFVASHVGALQAPREFFTAEPETLAWIDGFDAGSVLWDIGANVGAFSLYAGRRGDIDVLAFEPAPASYAALCANIAENRLDRVGAYCVALAERSHLGRIALSRTYAGSVYNLFDQEVPVDLQGRRLPTERRQAALGIAADDLVAIFGAPPPNHIKLDVDGTELAILRGAARLLRAPELRSLSVENVVGESPRNDAIAGLLGAAGFRPSARGRGGSDMTVNIIYRR